MTKIIPIIAIIILWAISTQAQENSLIGKWKYVSIKNGDKNLPIHADDGIEFTATEIRWRWLSTPHIHYYKLGTAAEKKVFTCFESPKLLTPEIKGIYKISDDQLIICDRGADQGFPPTFSSGAGTLIVLQRVVEK